MLLQVILEGIGLGVLLILVCAIGIRKGAVGMVHLYSQKVQERCVTLGLTTHAKIKRNALIFKAVCVPGYIAYVLVCVYALNGAKGFVQGFWQLLVILSFTKPASSRWLPVWPIQNRHTGPFAGSAPHECRAGQYERHSARESDRRCGRFSDGGQS